MKRICCQKKMTVHEVKTLFKLRTRMINVKANFSSNQDNLWCKACLLFKETQEHLIECPSIRIRVRHLIKFSDFDINMIFGTLGQQDKFAKNFILCWKQEMKFWPPWAQGTRAQLVLYFYDAVNTMFMYSIYLDEI